MTPELFVRLVRSDPFAWLWDPRAQKELFALLGPLWDRASDTERHELVAAIMAGYPEARFKSEVDPAERSRLIDHSVWERLVRLRRAGATLPQDALARLETLERENPKWRLTGEPSEDFSSWSETSYGYPTDTEADTLSELAAADEFAELFAVLAEGEDYDPYKEGRLRTWEGVISTEPEHALPFLRWMSAAGEWDKEVLTWTLHPLGGKPALLSDRAWAEVLSIVPREEWGSALYPLCRGIGALVATTDADGLSQTLALWDQALELALGYGETVERERDLLNAAINEPVGHLSEGILDLVARFPAGIESARPPALARVERILATADDDPQPPGGVAARVVVYSRHRMLSLVDRRWAAQHVLRRLSWETPREARISWEGLLWSPHVEPILWEEVVHHALGACRHYESIGRGKSSLGSLLVRHYLWGEEPSSADLRAALRSVDEHARIAAVRHASELLDGADEKAGELWRSRVHRLFEEAWPRERSCRSDALSADLFLLATRTGDAFPEAAESLAPLAGPTPALWLVLGKIDENGIASRYPQPVVDLLAEVVQRNQPSEGQRLQGILRQAERAGADVPAWLAEVAERR